MRVVAMEVISEEDMWGVVAFDVAASGRRASEMEGGIGAVKAEAWLVGLIEDGMVELRRVIDRKSVV